MKRTAAVLALGVLASPAASQSPVNDKPNPYETIVGWAKMPAQEPGKGLRGQDFVTISGGTGFVLNPATKNPAEAWALLAYMNSVEMLDEFQKIQPAIRARDDVAIPNSPFLTDTSQTLLPLIRGHVVTDLILITMWTFNVFTPFILTGGGPSYRTELLSIYNYRVAFRDFEFGKGAAVGVIIMLVNLAFALVYLSIGRKKAKGAAQ